MIPRTKVSRRSFSFPIYRLVLLAFVLAILYINCSYSWAQNSRTFDDAPPQNNIPPLKQLIDSLPIVYRSPYIEVRSDVVIPNLQELTEKLTEVISIDIRLQQLARFPQACRQIIVALASDQAANHYINHAFGGLAFKNLAFAAHAKGFFGRDDSYNWYVAGHEFEHVLMARLGASGGILPAYLSEGIACCVGIHYVLESQMGSKALQSQALKLAQARASDAVDIFQNYVRPQDLAIFRDQGKGFLAEHLGGLFIQFLANRTCGSPENFFIQWGNFAFELGQTKDLNREFKKHFGISLEKAQQDFTKYINETENNPQARFANTAYAGYPKTKPVKDYDDKTMHDQYSYPPQPRPVER